MLLQKVFVFYIFPDDFFDQLAFVHYVAALCQSYDHVEILLDEENCDALFSV
jgi:hypothetical protein